MENLDEDVIVTSVHPGGIRKDILEDLCSRFLINIPEEEKNDMVRICFQIELAHWFYLDFYRQEDPMLPGYGVQQFMEIIFNEFSFLNKTNASVQEVFANWKRYKYEVPVFGAIMLDESLDNCILVRGFHKRISWGFPKGKVNKDEDGAECAIREVKEETGFDLADYLDPNEYLERNFHDHRVRLYIVPSVPRRTDFEPKTRGEIKEIKWFSIDSLPSHKKDTTPRDKLGLNASSFFMVQPFVKDLRKWVTQKKHDIQQILTFSNSLSMPVKRSTYSAFTPVLNEPAKQKMLESAKEEEARLRRRKQEEQKRFQEIQLLQHPLRHDHTENERKLRDLLGMNQSQAAKTKKQKSQRQNSPKTTPQKQEKGARNQPEAIRKLLTGTVEISPVTTPERPLMKGFGLPPGYKEEKERLENAASPEIPYLVQKGRKPKKGKRSLDFPSDASKENSSMTFHTPLYAREQRVLIGSQEITRSAQENTYSNILRRNGDETKHAVPISDDLMSDSRLISRGWFGEESKRGEEGSGTCGKGKTAHPTDSLGPIGYGKESSIFQPTGTRGGVASYIFHDEKKGGNKNKSQTKLPGFSFEIPEFLNFSFDKKALMATLPPATEF